MKKTNPPAQSSSALAGVAAAFVCSGLWLGLGLFLFELQNGVA